MKDTSHVARIQCLVKHQTFLNKCKREKKVKLNNFGMHKLKLWIKIINSALGMKIKIIVKNPLLIIVKIAIKRLKLLMIKINKVGFFINI